ncbi:exodeoxyribonuclease VII large subunit [Rhodoferax sp.]|uniref:exodeoxyribonuclease VII large subunit n=1 Tax=Rhodoferax sp. TaxID=50421 RepID=UPI0026337152|nr:exodeoxyribonuclease VII large subunit [Rhodoferax sp.]MDD2923895.1 exodeoxyribonuclease VII large subunit [Rhodoferax sp.]
MTPSEPRIWQVGALCRAIADALQARFNPVTVAGELSGFSRAASGHCYFTLKDASGQLRCAMFKRAATGLAFAPRDGELVEVSGRLGVYEPRGDLQLIVEGMRRAGQGSLFEQFLQLKARLEAEGLFDAARKRALPVMPRAIGLVTSLGAAALHDVVTALQRRVPHIPVVLAPASVQGSQAPAELISSLSKLYQYTQEKRGLEPVFADKNSVPMPVIDVILLVRGGGAMEDLWAFNDEQLARVLAQSPVPVVCGVGHETDFTIADFVADLRAPTPTAAAELVAQPREAWLGALDQAQRRLRDALERQLDRHSQRLDSAASRLGRPSARLATQRLRLAACAQGLPSAARHHVQRNQQQLERLAGQLPLALQRGLQAHTLRLDRAALRLGLLDPHLVLERGYAWLSDAQGQAITRVGQTHPGQVVKATLVDGAVDLTVINSAG